MHGHAPLGYFALGGADAGKDRWHHEQVDQFRIEEGLAPVADDIAGDGDTSSGTVPPVKGDCVKGVDNRDDTRGEGNVSPFQLPGVAAAVPSLVMCEHAMWQFGIESVEWGQHVRAALRVREDFAMLCGRQFVVIVDDVEERLVDLADIVKEGDALHGALGALVEPQFVREDECIVRDTSYMCACLGIVGVDGIEQGLERRGGEALRALSAGVFVLQQQGACGECARRESRFGDSHT